MSKLAERQPFLVTSIPMQVLLQQSDSQKGILGIERTLQLDQSKPSAPVGECHEQFTQGRTARTIPQPPDGFGGFLEGVI
ncbi:MAG: hypothetical protein J0I63_12665 [Thiobacillus sp.]|nr:hypothetical protein [Thiobacillus sp.]